MIERLKPYLIGGAVIVVLLSLVPPLLVAMARVTKSSEPRVHLVPDMDNQPRFKTQQRNRMFADRRAMRPVIDGTVARGQLAEPETLHTGKVSGKWVLVYPLPLTMERMRRGKERYEIFCATCHGLTGAGNGPVAVRADRLQEGTWTPPTSFHTDTIRQRELGNLYNTITNGIRSMPAYGPQISVEDRWAIVAYIRALQRSQYGRIEDVPAEYRQEVRP